MQLFQLIIHNFFSFLIIISAIVFIHEFGHFFVARLCGVRVEEFSIGFGKKIFTFRDKKNTLWKFCLLPFGGYVKMYGDKNGASIPDIEIIKNMSSQERKISFIGKNVYQRIAIVAAGPIANFILTIIIFWIIFAVKGVAIVEPVVSDIVENSGAFEAKLQKGDVILAVNDKKITDFQELRQYVVTGLESEINLKIKRDEEILFVKIIPKLIDHKNSFDENIKIRSLGIMANDITIKNLNFYESFLMANKETYNLSVSILKTLGELITLQRSPRELGGPIKIVKYSGKSMEQDFEVVAWFVAMISLNLGVMNLLPIPVLDGGHLFYYFLEAFRGKPISQKMQMIGYNFGLFVVFSLMAFTTINDVLQILK